MPYPTPGALRASSCFVLLLAVTLAAGPIAAQDTAPRHHEGLGSLVFPTSGSADAQPHFERGVL
ncbi:MAG: hypothetical protein GWM90_11995, partial [Gemmatimonadetes bacterium]|nr:hypothetical protein [Gemmatimonadota bacterium]NIQ54723.1 hypothetical protein [Gemmatimonadota bacterium]NIU74929.1 hypothetical protein [Gammaproteobacteria bacterium]NIX44810.1 hypothetical protein [Gemmatimonadota bacterium]